MMVTKKNSFLMLTALQYAQSSDFKIISWLKRVNSFFIISTKIKLISLSKSAMNIISDWIEERRETCLPVHRNWGIAKRLTKNEREETILSRHFDIWIQWNLYIHIQNRMSVILSSSSWLKFGEFQFRDKAKTLSYVC